MLRKLMTLAATALAAMVFTSAAWAADSYTVSVTPTTAGTPAAPAPEQIATDLQIATDATGTPHDAVTSYAQLMPAEFTSMIDKFAVCPHSKIQDASTGTDHAPPDCPASSVLGGGGIDSVIPQLKIASTTDKLIVYNEGGGAVALWFHASKPTGFSGHVYGTVSQTASPFGPVVTWNLGPAANGEYAGVAVYVKRVQITWTPQSSSGTSTTGATGGPTTGSRRKRTLAACVRAAKRRYRKGSKRRARAIRRCHKRYRRSHRAKSSDTQSGAQIAPFESTGCASAKWPFEAQLKFKNGAPDEKFDQSVDCAPAGGTAPGGGGGGGGPGGGCGLPICPPPLPFTARP